MLIVSTAAFFCWGLLAVTLGYLASRHITTSPARLGYYVGTSYVLNAATAVGVSLLNILIAGRVFTADDVRFFSRTGFEIARIWKVYGVGTPLHPEQGLRLVHLVYAANYYVFQSSELSVRLFTAAIGALLIPFVFFLALSFYDEEGALRTAGIARFLPALLYWSSLPDRTIIWTSLAAVVFLPAILVGRDTTKRRILLASSVAAVSLVLLRSSEPMLAHGVGTIAIAIAFVTWFRDSDWTKGVSVSGGRISWELPSRGRILSVVGAVGVLLAAPWALFTVIEVIPVKSNVYCSLSDIVNPACQYLFVRDQVFAPSPLWVIKAPKLYTLKFSILGIAWYLLLPFFVYGTLIVGSEERRLHNPVLLVAVFLIAGNAFIWWTASAAAMRYRMLAWPYIFVIAMYGWSNYYHGHVGGSISRYGLRGTVAVLGAASFIYLVLP